MEVATSHLQDEEILGVVVVEARDVRALPQCELVVLRVVCHPAERTCYCPEKERCRGRRVGADVDPYEEDSHVQRAGVEHGRAGGQRPVGLDALRRGRRGEAEQHQGEDRDARKPEASPPDGDCRISRCRRSGVRVTFSVGKFARSGRGESTRPA